MEKQHGDTQVKGKGDDRGENPDHDQTYIAGLQGRMKDSELCLQLFCIVEMVLLFL